MTKPLISLLLLLLLVSACTPKFKAIPPPKSPSESRSGPGNPEFSGIVPRDRPAPYYPRVAAEQRLNGWVDVTFDLDTLGHTSNIRVVDSSPKVLFGEAAMDAVSQYLYDPIF